MDTVREKQKFLPPLVTKNNTLLFIQILCIPQFQPRDQCKKESVGGKNGEYSYSDSSSGAGSVGGLVHTSQRKPPIHTASEMMRRIAL